MTSVCLTQSVAPPSLGKVGVVGKRMERFRIDGEAGRDYEIRVEEVNDFRHDLVKTLIDIDLQTFSESTFSQYTATAFLKQGRVFLLCADDLVIGTCACMRAWDRPNEALLLSMGIRPGWRGKGLGQRFVRGVLERLKQRGIRSVALMVSKDNRRALKVYQDVGFDVVDEMEEDPRTRETLVVMRAQLSPITVVPLQD